MVSKQFFFNFHWKMLKNRMKDYLMIAIFVCKVFEKLESKKQQQ